MTTNAPRAPIDLDAFERDLKPGQAPTKPAKADPLAELARIVGQDDPFRALLEARGGTAPQAGHAAKTRVEPSLYDREDVFVPGAHAGAAHPEAVPADAFDQYLASVEQVHRDQDEDQDPAAFADDDSGYRNPKPGRANKRKTLMRVGAGVGVLALCVSGALAWNATHSGGADGGPITVLADKSPLKVAPETSDGVEIPDQNKQIYDRNAKDGQIKVVNREEQPIDVNQATRSVAQDAGQGGATPGGLLTESLGEPRKIRTVAVRPDAPPAPMQAQREPQAAAPSISPIPTMRMPEPSSPAPAPQRAATRSLSATPAPAPAEAAPAQAAETPAPRRPQQVANAAAPEATASTGESPIAEASAPAATGGFAVQIGVQGSESDARAALRKAQAKYSQLAGKPELIRQAEVNGKAIYRVRVGPFAKGEANSLCGALKSAGGACFVAAN